MASIGNRASLRLDVLGLFLAGLINTFLALFVAGIVLGPGTSTGQTDLLLRAGWIAENALRWQGGWLLGVYVVYVVLQYALNIGGAH